MEDSLSAEQVVLIVEPDRPARELYHRELSGHYRVISLPDAGDALPLLLADRVGAVVVEPGLLDSVEWEFVAAVKRTPRMRHIPVIICSVLDERRRGRELGVELYLVKPVLPATLLDALRRFVSAG